MLRIDGEDHPAPAGTFASIEPPASRTILNRSDAPVTALLIGVHPSGGYEPMSPERLASIRADWRNSPDAGWRAL